MAAPTITAQDNANGTGIGIFITGSPVGSTNTLQVTVADRTNWVGSGVVTNGDGSFTVPVQTTPGAPGVNLTHAWFVRADNSIGGLSNTALVLPTYGLDEPMFKTIVAIQRQLILADIGGIGGRVYRCESPGPVAVSLVQQWPAILIHPNEPERKTKASNRQTRWDYPVQVTIADSGCDYYTQLESHRYMRKQAMDWFDRNPLTLQSGSYKGDIVLAGPSVPVGSLKTDQGAEYFVSTFTLTASVWRAIQGGSS